VTAVNPSSATTGSVIGEATVQQTPLQVRTSMAWHRLTPGMTGSAVTLGDNHTNEYAININAAELHQEQNGYQIDDADIQSGCQSLRRRLSYQQWNVDTPQSKLRRDSICNLRRQLHGQLWHRDAMAPTFPWAGLTRLYTWGKSLDILSGAGSLDSGAIT
jgi:hypothetical protein